MKIGLLGNFGSGNLGNDGSLEAMLNFLRNTKPDAELVCICEFPTKVRKQLNVLAIPTRRAPFLDRAPFIRSSLNIIYILLSARKFDVLIAPGTGLLDDFTDRPWGMPATLATWCAIARLNRTRIALVSIGAGPIGHPISRWLMKAAARMAQFRSYRDPESKEFLRSIGLDTRHDPIYPDLAFRLPSPSAPTTPKNYTTVGLGIMSYYGWYGNREQGADIYRNYLKRLVQFVAWLLDRRFHVRLLIGDEGDQSAIQDFLNALALARPDYPREAIVYEPASSLHDVMNQISRTDFVVATRFHNIVCALKLRKPCISIGYAPKFDVLMAEMGLARFCQHIERLDIDLLTRQFTDLMANQGVYRRAIDEMNDVYQHRLSVQENVLLQSVLA